MTTISANSRSVFTLFGCHERTFQAYHGRLTNTATLFSNDHLQLRTSRPFQSSLHTHIQAVSPIHALHTRGCQAGQTLDQHLEVRCHASKGQHANAKQQGPNSLLAPALQKQWDHTANADIDIKSPSRKKVQGVCDQCPDGHPHSWSATVGNRTRGTGCPLCGGCTVCKHNSLATKAPSVQLSGIMTPKLVHLTMWCTHRATILSHWQCAVCGCKWQATPNARVSKLGSGCPRVLRTQRVERSSSQRLQSAGTLSLPSGTSSRMKYRGTLQPTRL